MQARAPDAAQVKLACRNLWKVYRGGAAPYFGRNVSTDDADELARRMRADGAIPAVVDVSFDVHVGEIFVIMGLSGSGKSTVVRCLSRLVEPTRGEVRLDGEDLLEKSARELIDIRRHKMGMVFQNFGLLPHLNVFDNIAFPLSLQGMPVSERNERVSRVIQLVGLEGRETSYPRQLSGGQQQRVGIARSLAVEPELWFLDEPFSALDPLIRRQMQDEFLSIQGRLKKSIVFITHDFLEALRIADRMMIMRDGMVVQVGAPADLILNPADDYVAEFTEDVPMVRVLKASDVLDPARTETPAMPQRDADTTVEDLLPLLASHPEGISIVRDGASIGVVTDARVISALAHDTHSRPGADALTPDRDATRGRPDLSRLATSRPLEWIWVVLILATLALLAVQDTAGWLVEYPDAWQVPITPWLNVLMQWCVDTVGPAFRAFSAVADVPMTAVRELLNWLPWSVTLTVLTFVAFTVAGWRLAAFAFFATLYMLVIGYWTESMNSLALVAISVPSAVAIGFALGTLAFYSARAERIITPTLDLMQTVPAFAYLLPILLLFGFGPVVGLIASILYAFPPTVRNTHLGLARVSTEVIEAGLMAGATPGQLFWRVRAPSALRQILLGVNQTTMAAFSMVIIASIIGGTADIGWEVLSTMRKAQFGESLLAGIVIALMAMVMDRLTAAVATAEPQDPGGRRDFLARHRNALLAVVLGVAVGLLAQLVPLLKDYPEAWEIYPARYLNDAVTWLVVEHAKTINLIKSWAFFFVMLPVKTGLDLTVTPFTWGFEFTAPLRQGYGVLATALVVYVAMRRGIARAALIAFLAIMLYFGITRLPWPAMLAMAALLGWQLGGPRLALGTAAGLGFLIVAGVWPQTMLSVYLCGLAVLLSFAIGVVLGILAAEFDGLSAFLRPINDTLQTMPLFVILIPFVMIFKIGEFTALLAIMAYAVVPAIRYAEHALRNVPAEVVEASTCFGCTRLQLLWRVKLPLAMPVIMLGLNQTIMFGIAMLVIAALVGTNGLGQRVYIGLGDGDFGVGIVAGIGMAFIAMIADRMTQGLSRAYQARTGMRTDA